jgi:hypothetical protein
MPRMSLRSCWLQALNRHRPPPGRANARPGGGHDGGGGSIVIVVIARSACDEAIQFPAGGLDCFAETYASGSMCYLVYKA